MATRTRTRRRRCDGPCGKLYPPGELARVGPRERLCPTCQAQIAVDLAPADTVPPAGAEDSAGMPLSADQAPGGDDPVTTMTGPAQLLPAPTVQIDLDRYKAPDNRQWWTDLATGTPKPPGWPLEKPRLSPSALGSFMRCPEQFRRSYLLGLREPSRGTSVAGSAVHEAAATNWRYKIAEGADMPLRMWEEAYHRAFSREVDRSGGINQIDWGETGRGAKRHARTADNIRFMALATAKAYAERVAPMIRPLAAERVFALRVPGVPVPIVGYIDLVTERTVIDLKLGDRKFGVLQPDWRLQGLIYMRAEERDVGWHSMNWKGEYHAPSDAPGLVMRRTAETHQLGASAVLAVYRQIMATFEAFGRDQPWPPGYAHTWACSSCHWQTRGCEWWQPRVEAFGV